MSVVAGDFLKWIQKEVTHATEEGGVRQFLLFHTVDGTLNAKIDTFPFDPDEMGWQDTAQNIWDAAEADASTRSLTSRDRYTVVCFRKSEEPYSQRSFQIRAATARQALLLGDEHEEPANERGIISQQLRHTETFARLLTLSADDQMTRLVGENRRLHEAVQNFQTQQLNMYELLENLNERKHERELERAASERKSAQFEKMMGMVTAIAPALIMQLTQPKQNQAAAELPAEYVEWLGSLDEEEFNNVCMAQAPNKREAFLRIYRNARAQASANSPTTDAPEEDGAAAETSH